LAATARAMATTSSSIFGVLVAGVPGFGALESLDMNGPREMKTYFLAV
jgi:hypothetical protein